jgi:hypothetical protein
MGFRSGSAILAAGATITQLAGATPPGVAFDADSVQYDPPSTERRGGFAMGLTSGYGVGTYSGYELSVDALNDPSARQSTGLAMATNLSLWLGGSPRDWLTVGLGLSFYSAQLTDTFGAGSAFLLHVEGFPLYSLGGTFVDLGVGFEGGLGGIGLADAEDKQMEDPVAESGSLSTLAFKVFWEPIRYWHLSMGPAFNYTMGFSQTMQIHQATLGFRTALYGVQPKKKPPDPEMGSGLSRRTYGAR